MLWSAYDGSFIKLRQSKTGVRVTIPVGAPLKLALDAAKASRGNATTILVTSEGTPWTGDGFRSSWRKACIKAGVMDLTFHDLRGSAITRLAIVLATVPEISTISGLSLGDVHGILDKHYLKDDVALAENARSRNLRAGRHANDREPSRTIATAPQRTKRGSWV